MKSNILTRIIEIFKMAVAILPILCVTTACGDDEPSSGEKVIDISTGEQTNDGFHYGDFYYTFGNNAATIFKADKLVVNATIPDKVELNGELFDVSTIADRAFKDCTAMRTITVGKSVNLIGYDAFSNCSSLITVNWNAKDYKDSDSNYATFYFVRGISSFNFGNEVKRIPPLLCAGMTNLKSVTIPNSVTSIGNQAFSGCSGLSSIVVNSGNPVYDSSNNCNAIIETASKTLIVGCKNTVIPNSVTSIGGFAFYGCSGLTSVTIPNSVTSIGESAFCGCSGLTSVTIPNSVTSIGYSAFRNCSGLTSVTIPNSVTTIGDLAFRNCSGLTSVTIPNSVTSIGDYAFSGCSGLTSVTNYAETPQSIYDDVFYVVNTSKVKLYVKRESIDKYKSAPVWKYFDIQAMD